MPYLMAGDKEGAVHWTGEMGERQQPDGLPRQQKQM